VELQISFVFPHVWRFGGQAGFWLVTPLIALLILCHYVFFPIYSSRVKSKNIVFPLYLDVFQLLTPLATWRLGGSISFKINKKNC
jgi:hypothetical protein